MEESSLLSENPQAGGRVSVFFTCHTLRPGVLCPGNALSALNIPPLRNLFMEISCCSSLSFFWVYQCRLKKIFLGQNQTCFSKQLLKKYLFQFNYLILEARTPLPPMCTFQCAGNNPGLDTIFFKALHFPSPSRQCIARCFSFKGQRRSLLFWQSSYRKDEAKPDCTLDSRNNT